MNSRKILFAALAASVLFGAAHAAQPDTDQRDGDPKMQRPESDHKAKGPKAAPGDAMRNDAKRGDAMGGNAMSHGAMQSDDKRGDAMGGNPMSHGAMQNDNRRGDAMGSMPKRPGNAWQWKDDRGTMHRDRDRYWQQGYSNEVPKDRIFGTLRNQGYSRFDGAPYWYQGRFVVKSFDRSGRRIFIEINPYTGAYIGVVRF